MHAIFLPDASADNDLLVIDGDEAKHALRVKRLREGERLLVLDGKGLIMMCQVSSAKRTLELQVIERQHHEPTSPAVHVCSATPKGPRVEPMIDSLVQIGAASWAPMRTKLGVVDPREGKLGRLERIATEALKQCQRPWAMEMRSKRMFDEALQVEGGVQIVLADAGGVAYERSGAAQIRLLVGPEGGWRDEEIDQARTAGAQIARFGPHAMRIEVAAPTATGIILDIEQRNH